jgi:hypothetical protein
MPAIHALNTASKGVDTRYKAGHDAVRAKTVQTAFMRRRQAAAALPANRSLNE